MVILSSKLNYSTTRNEGDERNERHVVESFHFSRKRLTAMTNDQRATVGFAPNNTVISTEGKRDVLK